MADFGGVLVRDCEVRADSGDFYDVRKTPMGMVEEFVHGMANVLSFECFLEQGGVLIPVYVIEGVVAFGVVFFHFALVPVQDRGGGVSDILQECMDTLGVFEERLQADFQFVIFEEGILVFDSVLHFQHDRSCLLHRFFEGVGEETVDFEEAGNGCGRELEGAVQFEAPFRENEVQGRRFVQVPEEGDIGWFMMYVEGAFEDSVFFVEFEGEGFQFLDGKCFEVGFHGCGVDFGQGMLLLRLSWLGVDDSEVLRFWSAKKSLSSSI